MTQKPRNGDLKELKSKKIEACTLGLILEIGQYLSWIRVCF